MTERTQPQPTAVTVGNDDVRGFETNPLEIGHALTPFAVVAVGAYLIWKDGKKPIGQVVNDYVRTHIPPPK